MGPTTDMGYRVPESWRDRDGYGSPMVPNLRGWGTRTGYKT